MAEIPNFSLVRASSQRDYSAMNRHFSDWLQQDDPDNWTVGIHDFPLYSIIDPNGLFMGVLNGEIVVIICAVNYNSDYSFIGAFWANPKYRGKGMGTHLWNAGLKHCGFRTIGLYAAPGMVARYERDGFRQCGQSGLCEIRTDNILANRRSISENIVDYNNTGHIPFEDVAQFCRKYSPADRRDFLKAWIAQAGCMTLLYVKNHIIKGLGVLRRGCESGRYLLGPLYAGSKDIAVEIMADFVLRISHPSVIYFGVLKDNPDVEQFVKDAKGRFHEEVATVMYRGQNIPHFDVNGVFAVTCGDIGG
ncbi:uncharacterized protein LOC129587646 [Paramacrobiotus metropolitanus]|uniref:uncharacterized protein LOC129587646 n=1 Tax=Paramacrobiotus metropolitanus TaxID=2943436 RepID=UPI002446196D|nr:uncharacterized protein LOC129587646 [Paramacrobiotus metropolitanus]XP_055337451.1 uncharacterized protein LOC129587646 [Paramacrobiotus metropolitanus]